MIAADSIVDFIIFGLVGAAINTAICEEGGFFSCFDIEQGKKIKTIQKFWHRLDDWFFGKDKETSTDTYTQHTPEVIKKDSLSAK